MKIYGWIKDRVEVTPKIMRKPGFEPGSSAWKAPILTTRLFTHAYLPINLNLLKGLHEIILGTVDVGYIV